jgi:orotate phosphoribosyltransferase
MELRIFSEISQDPHMVAMINDSDASGSDPFTTMAKKIYDVAHLTGEFKLRSGQVSHEYFDKYRFEAQPTLLLEIAKQMVPLIPAGTEVLAGLEMGGIPIATALSLETGIPCVFVRKEAKAYGTCKFAEGLEIKGKKVLVVEDVVTTGGQVVLSTADLRSIGAEISHVPFCQGECGSQKYTSMPKSSSSILCSAISRPRS